MLHSCFRVSGSESRPWISTIQHQYWSQWVWLTRSSGRRSRLHRTSQRSPSQICREKSHLSPERVPGSAKRLRGSVTSFHCLRLCLCPSLSQVLLTKNAKVWIACRDVSRGEAALKELKELTGQDAHLLKLDLANLRSIKQSVEEFLRYWLEICHYLNKDTNLLPTGLKTNFTSSSIMRTCATSYLFEIGSLVHSGVMHPPVDRVTDDGYDLQFGTNVLGHFYLTKLLLPILISTAKSSSEGTVRVVNTASLAHWFGNLEFDTFKDGPKRRAKRTFWLYGQSKTVS